MQSVADQSCEFHKEICTCWTRMFPPFRIEMPNLRVTVTMAPRRPGDDNAQITQDVVTAVCKREAAG